MLDKLQGGKIEKFVLFSTTDQLVVVKTWPLLVPSGPTVPSGRVEDGVLSSADITFREPVERYAFLC